MVYIGILMVVKLKMQKFYTMFISWDSNLIHKIILANMNLLIKFFYKNQGLQEDILQMNSSQL